MKILVPVDGSEHALDAVRFALQLRSAGLSTTFVLATIQEPTYLYEVLLTPGADALESVLGVVGSAALLAAEVHRASMPGQPGACDDEVGLLISLD